MILNNVEILTMDEWYYIDDEGEVEKLETSKSTLDVVRVYKNNSYFKERNFFKCIIEKNKIFTKIYCDIYSIVK